jgi:hypothetical protein
LAPVVAAEGAASFDTVRGRVHSVVTVRSRRLSLQEEGFVEDS